MAISQVEIIPTAVPGGEKCVPSKSRPIDLVHLARQTCGDRDVEEAVLAMFMHQLAEVGDRLEKTRSIERQELAHGLIGAARGVGAFGIANCAEAIEDAPDDSEALVRLADEIIEVKDFVASITR